MKKLFSKGAFHIASSSLFSKIVMFVLSVIIIRSVDKETFGDISYARTLLAIISPFMGLGVMHSLLRFGSISEQKKELCQYSTFWATILNLVIVLFCTLFSDIITKKIPNSEPFFLIIVWSLIATSLFQISQTAIRLNKDNSRFAKSNVVFVIINLVITLSALYLGGIYWYVGAQVIVPLLGYWYNTRFINYKGLSIKFVKGLSLKEFYKYGLWVGVGSIAYQLLTSLDVVMVGQILENSELVALYRVGAMIPIQLGFIPSSFMAADFVELAEKHNDMSFLRMKYLGYLKFFFSVSIAITIGVLLMGEWAVTLIYTEKYVSSVPVLNLLTISMIFSFAIKVPIGVIFQAIGKANINVIIVWISLAINLLLNYFFIHQWGVIGAAWATLITNVISSIIATLWFIRFTGKEQV